MAPRVPKLPRAPRALLALLALALALPPPPALAAHWRAQHPGARAGGCTLLPTGWSIAPAGRGAKVGDFPLGLCTSPDGRFAVTSHSGDGGGFDVVELASGRRTDAEPVPGAWLGITFFAGGRGLAASGGVRNVILLYAFEDGRAQLSDSIALGPAWSAGGQYPQGRVIDYGPGAIWPTALAADDPHERLFVVSRLDSSLRSVDLARRAPGPRLALGAVPYACRLSHDGARVFVSLWDAAEVAVVDAGRMVMTRRIAVGAHPTDLVESPDGGRLFVADANRNTVSVVDLALGRVTETLDVALDRSSPPGNTPDALDLDPARGRLYVASADVNCVTVFDVARPGRSRPLGLLPVGWYPTALRVVPATGTIVVANGKGTGSSRSDLLPADTSSWCRYLSFVLRDRGTLSIVPAPGPAALARGTRAVLASGPRTAPGRARPPGPNPVPRHVGERSPIRHVFYVFKENRSYDQVLGDLPQGDGDSALCTYGEAITPNHHALARAFVLLDDTYCESDGSADGHNWGMAAYAADYVVKSAGTSPVYDYEGGNPLSYPEGGFLWDACRRAGVSFRSYGEYVFNPDDPRDTVRAGIASLAGHVAPRYRGYDMNASDLDRYRAWLEEFDRYDREGGLPELSIIRLPNDHTEGTCTGRPTPRAHVAGNDLALGLMVERISHSRYWKDSAVFVIEDDAANGPDHVDAHRTVALVASPWARRRAVDHTLYTNAGMLRTIELILGLAPMSRFDAAATPMFGSFTNRADFTPWTHENARVDLDEKNLAGAFGQARCDRMNWTVADACPPAELTEILWHDARGAATPPPPQARAAYALLRQGAGDAEHEEE